MEADVIFEPQPGPQFQFLSTTADIAIYGGAAGGGKSFALLLDALRYFEHDGPFPYTIFRRTIPQITNPGALWDEGCRLYLPLGCMAHQSGHYFEFEKGLKVKFSHLEHEKTVYEWQGSQLPVIGFDELAHFTETQFFYMLSRNRSVSGRGGRIRATVNPDPDSFVRTLVDWWIGDDGYPIQERSGIIRWFTRQEDKIIWHDKKISENAKSITFIPSKLEDNKILMDKDPGYKTNLESLSYVDRMRLLHGNWNVRANAGTIFKRSYFKIVETFEQGGPIIRYWDRASSEKEGAAYTVGLKMTRAPSGRIFITDIQRFRASPGQVMQSVKNVCLQDGRSVTVGIEQDPGQAGVAEAQSYVKELAGNVVKLFPARQDKVTRAKPLSAQAEFGNVFLVRGKWNEEFLKEAENFPDSSFKDQVDAASGAFNALTQGSSGEFTKDMSKSTGTIAGGRRGKISW